MGINFVKSQESTPEPRRGIARLIDAYEQQLVDKSEFEPRIRAARQQLQQLEQQLKQQVDQQARQKEIKLVIDSLQTFSQKVAASLEQADWQTRREIITTLVKRVELEKERVKIVYRVDLSHFDQGPERGHLEHCTARVGAVFWLVRRANMGQCPECPGNGVGIERRRTNLNVLAFFRGRGTGRGRLKVNGWERSW
jgi:hypothetical protein